MIYHICKICRKTVYKIKLKCQPLTILSYGRPLINKIKKKNNSKHFLCNYQIFQVTYIILHKAHLAEFPTRKGFVTCIKKNFDSGSGKVYVQHWACLFQGKSPKWWGTLSCCLKGDWSKTLIIYEKKHIIKSRNTGQFFQNHQNYHYAYKCICEDDNSFHHSKPQLNLDDIPSCQIKKKVSPSEPKIQNITCPAKPYQ